MGSALLDSVQPGSPPLVSTRQNFVRECPKLVGCVFDCEDTRQSGKFEPMMEKLANYIGSKYNNGVERKVEP
jgi:hypothetical protein